MFHHQVYRSGNTYYQHPFHSSQQELIPPPYNEIYIPPPVYSTTPLEIPLVVERTLSKTQSQSFKSIWGFSPFQLPKRKSTSTRGRRSDSMTKLQMEQDLKTSIWGRSIQSSHELIWGR